MRRTAEVAAWWVVLTFVWVASLSAATAPDVLAGAVCGLLCAVLAVAARRAIGQAWRPVPRWAAWLGPLLLAVPADTARLLIRVLPRLVRDRRSAGSLRRIRPPAGEEAAAGFRRAWGTLALSATPGSFVVDWPPDGRPAVIHTLGSGPPQMDEVVVR
jgi:multisubunit Na+/H+ antiporter MnhE subunit